MRVSIFAPLPSSSPIPTNAISTAKALAFFEGADVTWIEPFQSPLSRLGNAQHLPDRCGDTFAEFVEQSNLLPGDSRAKIVSVINRKFMTKKLKKVVAGHDAAICYTLPAYKVARQLGPTIYHVVDWPGAWAGKETPDSWPLAIRHADLILASSQPLKTHLNKYGVACELAENCYDSTTFSLSSRPDNKTALYMGAVNQQKINFGLLQRTIDANRDWKFLIVGPQSPHDQEAIQQTMRNRTNVEFAGAVNKAEAADMMRLSRLTINPAPEEIGTKYSLPLKLVESVASGRPFLTTGHIPGWAAEVCRDLTRVPLAEADEIDDLVLIHSASRMKAERSYQARASMLRSEIQNIQQQRSGFRDQGGSL